MQLIKKIFAAIILFGMLTASGIVYADEKVENFKVYGVEPMTGQPSTGKTLLDCFSKWRDFLSALIGYESFTDYWRDFFLWPSHFADVMNVQMQLNKSRYAVMAAFMRCDLNNLKAVTNSYYRLEAELYYVRHVVDSESGFPRENFASEMIDYLMLLKPRGDELQERALYEGYFDLFESKYRERVKTYSSFDEDPLFQQLGKKWDDFMNIGKDFKNLGAEMKHLGEEIIGSDEKHGGKKPPAGNSQESPTGVFGKIIKAVGSKFDACVTTKDNRYCAFGESRVDAPENKFGDTPGVTNSSRGQTFGEAMVGLEKQEQKKTEDVDEAQMRSRYEVLYGQVNGDGVKALMGKIDELISILGQESSEPLNMLKECANEVTDRTC